MKVLAGQWRFFIPLNVDAVNAIRKWSLAKAKYDIQQFDFLALQAKSEVTKQMRKNNCQWKTNMGKVRNDKSTTKLWWWVITSLQ